MKLTLQEDFQGSTFVPPSELTEEEPDHRLKAEVKTYADMNIIIITLKFMLEWQTSLLTLYSNPTPTCTSCPFFHFFFLVKSKHLSMSHRIFVWKASLNNCNSLNCVIITQSKEKNHHSTWYNNLLQSVHFLFSCSYCAALILICRLTRMSRNVSRLF